MAPSSPMTDRRQRLALFASAYVAQGAMLSYFLTFNVLYLRQHGHGAEDIGLFQAALAAPFALKILLGMVSDRFSLLGLGHRRPYIVLGLLAQLAGMAALPAIPVTTDLHVFFTVALFTSIGMALYDTCTDGLALDTTPAHERGLVQGVMVGARAAGILLALLFGGYLADHAGWPWVFVMVALLAVPPLLLTLRFPADAAPEPGAGFSWSAFRGLARAQALFLAAAGFVYAFALDGVLSYLSFHPDAGSLDAVGRIGSIVALSMAGRILGAFASGRLTDRLGLRHSLNSAVLLSTLGCLGLSLAGGTLFLATSCFLFGAAYGYFTAVYSAAAMRQCDPRVAASMFAIFMMFINLGVAGGQALGGRLTEGLGFQLFALVMSGLNLVNLLLVRKIAVRPASV